MAFDRDNQLRIGGSSAIFLVGGLIVADLYTGVVPTHLFSGLHPPLAAYGVGLVAAGSTGWIAGALPDDIEEKDQFFHGGIMALLLLLGIGAVWKGVILSAASSEGFALRFMFLGGATGWLFHIVQDRL